MASAPEQIERFIERYKTFAQEKSEVRVSQFTRGFGQVRAALEALANLERHSQQELASRFNLFRVLGVETRERQTHSAFLAELFRPNGTHGQGHLFLEVFLQYCWNKFESFPRLDSSIETAHWDVDCEKPVYEGQLDIVVEAPKLKFLMVVENKIGALEQEDQIRRYQSWLSRQRYDRRVLIYLTPDGRRATTAAGEDYFRLSYAKDIVEWLGSTLPNVKAPRVREAVTQYRDLIRGLFPLGEEEKI
jgi:hypothetical protein